MLPSLAFGGSVAFGSGESWALSGAMPLSMFGWPIPVH